MDWFKPKKLTVALAESDLDTDVVKFDTSVIGKFSTTLRRSHQSAARTVEELEAKVAETTMVSDTRVRDLEELIRVEKETTASTIADYRETIRQTKVAMQAMERAEEVLAAEAPPKDFSDPAVGTAASTKLQQHPVRKQRK